MPEKWIGLLLGTALLGFVAFGCGGEATEAPVEQPAQTQSIEPDTGEEDEEGSSEEPSDAVAEETIAEKCKRLKETLSRYNVEGLDSDSRASIERQIEMTQEQIKLAGCE